MVGLFASGLLAAGCLAANVEFDDEIEFEPKSVPYAENSAAALGILKVANTYSLANLKTKAKVSAKAAKSIIDSRKGDDEVLGTADDTVFQNLEHLDILPFVGPVTFHKLYDEAAEAGLLPATGGPAAPVVDNEKFNRAFSDSPCDGYDSMRFNPNMREEAAIKMLFRERKCSTDGFSCSEWRRMADTEIPWSSRATGTLKREKRWSNSLDHSLAYLDSSGTRLWVDEIDSSYDMDELHGHTIGLYPTNNDARLFLNGADIEVNGNTNAKCFTASFSDTVTQSGIITERGFAIFAQDSDFIALP